MDCNAVVRQGDGGTQAEASRQLLGGGVGWGGSWEVGIRWEL